MRPTPLKNPGLSYDSSAEYTVPSSNECSHPLLDRSTITSKNSALAKNWDPYRAQQYNKMSRDPAAREAGSKRCKQVGGRRSAGEGGEVTSRQARYLCQWSAQSSLCHWPLANFSAYHRLKHSWYAVRSSEHAAAAFEGADGVDDDEDDLLRPNTMLGGLDQSN